MVPVESIVVLIQMVSVIVIATLLAVSIPVIRRSLFKKQTQISVLLVIVIFGLLSIYGTYSGCEIYGARINVRDLGPMIAGLIAGPAGGVGAGLIGGIHRYSMGGVTALPCAISTIIAGFIGGMISLWYHRQFCGGYVAVAFAALMECLHMGLILLLAQPFSQAVEIVESIALPMIAGNVFGMAAFSVIIAWFLQKNDRCD